MKKHFWLVLSVILVGCATLPVLPWCAKARATAVFTATAPDSRVSGTASFIETSKGLRVSVRVAHATPGMHGFHIHEGNSCGDMGKAAGGHLNPAGMKHGYLPKEGLLQVHAGDLGNIKVGASGRGSRTYFIPEMSVVGGNFPVAGKTVILHAKQDDLASQPAGNAGERIACGVIMVQGQ